MNEFLQIETNAKINVYPNENEILQDSNSKKGDDHDRIISQSMSEQDIPSGRLLK